MLIKNEQPILFSIDLEDHTERYDNTSRYINNTEKYLVFLEQNQLKATFFTVGLVAKHAPKLVQKISDAGHEIACHSYAHVPLSKQSPEQFKVQTLLAKTILEQVSGKKICGFRAPIFSLTKQTNWAANILQELDFEYSSSVLPNANPLYGYPRLPQTPFIWSSGLIELPVVVGGIGKFRVPFLGGFYLRYLPNFVIRKFLNEMPKEAVAWTYLHPYDIDYEEVNWKINNAAHWVSLLLWLNRKNTLIKIERLKRHLLSATFSQKVLELRNANLPIIGNI